MKRSLLLLLCLNMQAGNQESLLNQTVRCAFKPFVSARDVSIAAFSYAFSYVKWLYEHTIGWVWHKFFGVKAEVSSGGGGSSTASKKRKSLPCVASVAKKPKLQKAEGVTGAQNSPKPASVPSGDRASEAGGVNQVASQNSESFDVKFDLSSQPCKTVMGLLESTQLKITKADITKAKEKVDKCEGILLSESQKQHVMPIALEIYEEMDNNMKKRLFSSNDVESIQNELIGMINAKTKERFGSKNNETIAIDESFKQAAVFVFGTYIMGEIIFANDLYRDIREYLYSPKITLHEASILYRFSLMYTFERLYKVGEFAECIDFHQALFSNKMVRNMFEEYILITRGHKMFNNNSIFNYKEEAVFAGGKKLNLDVMEQMQSCTIGDFISINSLLNEVKTSYKSLIIGKVTDKTVARLRDAIRSAKNDEAGRSAINQVLILLDMIELNIPFIFGEIADEQFEEYKNILNTRLSSSTVK